MKIFTQREMMEAVLFSMKGGQAIHLHSFNQGHPLFKRYPLIAHLFDRDEERLISTARRLGVRVIKVERKGEQAQHIDLCGKPFERACKEATEHTLAVDGLPAEVKAWISKKGEQLTKKHVRSAATKA